MTRRGDTSRRRVVAKVRRDARVLRALGVRRGPARLARPQPLPLVRRRGTHVRRAAAVRYSALQYDTVRYSTLQCVTVRHSVVQHITVRYSTLQHVTVRYSTVQYSTVKYGTVQYSTVQNSTVT